ncbi:MAG: glycosyltransferase [Bacteroidota bacterium]|nr:glycosyltransferase [Bacteroidota bacterium]
MAFYKKPEVKNGNKEDLPPVSIVVCIQNEEHNLKNLLASLLNQDYPDFEIVIVDDRSTDDTYNFLKLRKAAHPQLKVIHVENVPEGFNGKKYGLTLGIKSAKNDILLFTDADCEPVSNKWIQEMAGAFTDSKKIVLGYSKYYTFKSYLNTFIRFETLYTGIIYLSSALAGRPYMGVGRNIAHRRSFFLANKGFKGHMKVTGGDDDLYVNENADNKNTGIAIGKDATVLSIPKSNWNAYFTQKKRHLSVGKYYDLRDKIKLNLLATSQLFFWLTFFILIISWQEPYIVLAGFVLRICIVCVIFHHSIIKLDDNFNIWLVPVFDLLFVFYYFIIGYTAFFSKDIKWN